MMEKFRIVSESGDVPHDKDEWFEDYERELDENETYGEDWA